MLKGLYIIIKTHSSAHQSAVSNHPWMPWPNLLNLARICSTTTTYQLGSFSPQHYVCVLPLTYTRSVYSNLLPFHFVSVATRHTIQTPNFAESAFSERIYTVIISTLYTVITYRKLSELITDVIKLYDFIIIIISSSRFSFKIVNLTRIKFSS